MKILLLAWLMSCCFSLDIIGQRELAGIAKNNEAQAAGNPLLLLGVAGDYCDARMYQDAERVWALAMKGQAITDPMMYSNMSVFIGKQRKFPEAVAWADKALAIDKGHFHAKIVKASWLTESGDHVAGDRWYQECVADSATRGSDPALYWSCMACYLASRGDVKALEQAITQVINTQDDASLTFLRRDIVFDPYREAAWFLRLVGPTVVQPAAPAHAPR